MPELHAYYSESWFTAEGAALKLRRLKRKGLPNMTNWRFVTVTIADRSISPMQAHALGCDRMRRFFAKWREVIGEFRWCWKLEFHEEDGFPHWHIALEYRKKIPPEFLQDVEAWWGLGRVNIERIKGESLYYLFKYIAKAPDELPLWVQEYRGRLRVFQTSQGFFENSEKRKTQKKEPKTCMVKLRLRDRLEWDARKAIIKDVDGRGRARLRVVKLHETFNRLLVQACQWAILRQVPLVAPGVITIDEHQKQILIYGNQRNSGLGRIVVFEHLAAA